MSDSLLNALLEEDTTDKEIDEVSETEEETEVEPDEDEEPLTEDSSDFDMEFDSLFESTDEDENEEDGDSEEGDTESFEEWTFVGMFQKEYRGYSSSEISKIQKELSKIKSKKQAEKLLKQINNAIREVEIDKSLPEQEILVRYGILGNYLRNINDKRGSALKDLKNARKVIKYLIKNGNLTEDNSMTYDTDLEFLFENADDDYTLFEADEEDVEDESIEDEEAEAGIDADEESDVEPDAVEEAQLEVFAMSLTQLAEEHDGSLNEARNIVRLNRQARLRNLSNRTALVMARRNNDPLYKKYTKFNGLRLRYRTQIVKKYGSKATSYARKIMSK